MVYVIAALVAAIVGYFTWRVQRGRGVKSARLPQIQGARPSSVRIVALGHKEAGKTILLASMWRELAIEGSRRIRMVTELSGDERELQRICNEIERSGDSFPSGTLTGETTEWNFLLQATNPVGQPVDVLRFSYLDYSGEWLDRIAMNEEPPPTFDRALRYADVIVGVIDGQQIAHLMDRGSADDLAVRLSNLCLLLRRRDVKTLHIIITKWDLLKRQHTLEQVRDRLKEFNGPFQRLLETPRSGGVRIIPVSSLGSNGFVYEDRSGTMHKSAVKGWFPEHVLAPLGCTIPDALATDVRTLRDRGTKGRNLVIKRGDVSHVFFWVTLVLGLAVPYGSNAPAMMTAIREVIMKVSLDRLMDSFFKVVGRSGKAATPRILDDNAGLLHALRFLREEVDSLERDEPAARLTFPEVR